MRRPWSAKRCRRWREVPLGGPLQRGCQFCFAANDGEAKTHEIAAYRFGLWAAWA
jgi:hypothetical protein